MQADFPCPPPLSLGSKTRQYINTVPHSTSHSHHMCTPVCVQVVSLQVTAVGVSRDIASYHSQPPVCVHFQCANIIEGLGISLHAVILHCFQWACSSLRCKSGFLYNTEVVRYFKAGSYSLVPRPHPRGERISCHIISCPDSTRAEGLVTFGQFLSL